MPFTLSHPAAVLPLRRTGLPFAALVCGSMAPDLHMVLPRISDAATHRWQGVPTLDVVLGLGLTAVWVLALGPAARAAAPAWVRSRLRPAPRYTLRTWALAVVGVLVGAVTHVGWDTFTHEEMWGGQHVPWLYRMHHGYPGYEWSQYGSSLVGLLVVAGYLALRLRRRAPHPASAHPRASSARVALGLPMLLAAGLALTVTAAMVLGGWRGTDQLLAAGLRSFLVVSTVLGLGGATVWAATGARPRQAGGRSAA